MTTRNTEAQTAYRDLVDEIAERHDPVCGWLTIAQLPLLTPAQLAICLRADPDLLDDVMVNAEDLADLLKDAADPQQMKIARDFIADAILCQLRNNARQALLRDLQDRDEERTANAYAAEVQSYSL